MCIKSNDSQVRQEWVYAPQLLRDRQYPHCYHWVYLPNLERLVLDITSIHACKEAIAGSQYRGQLHMGKMAIYAIAAASGFGMDGTQVTQLSSPRGMSRLTLLVSWRGYLRPTHVETARRRDSIRYQLSHEELSMYCRPGQPRRMRVWVKSPIQCALDD